MRLLEKLEANKPELLLASVVALLVLSPVVEEMGARPSILGFVSLPVILSTVIYASVNKLQSIVAVFLAASWFSLNFVFPEAGYPVLTSVSYILLLSLATYTMLGHIFRATRVDRGVLASAITVYLLLGIIWSSLYAIIYATNPAAFDAPLVNPDYAAVHFIYYSYVTLTTLGYGDITPLSPAARMLSASEAVTGVFYIAILVAQLVSLFRAKLPKA